MTTHAIDYDAYRRKLTAACQVYEKAAPTVAAHCDDLYVRMDDSADAVTLTELLEVQSLWADGDWAPPAYAANRIYKLRERLGMPTTGHAGF